MALHNRKYLYHLTECTSIEEFQQQNQRKWISHIIRIIKILRFNINSNKRVESSPTSIRKRTIPVNESAKPILQKNYLVRY